MSTAAHPTVFAPLIGQTARGCWLGYGSVLFLEFGQPQPLAGREIHPRGEWGLWCDQIEWRIEQVFRVIAGSEDDRATMESGIQTINGRSLVSGEMLPSGDSILTFSDDVILRTFVITSEEDARWKFRDRNGKYFYWEPERSSPEEEQRSDTHSEAK
jgi:hypothetical protein